MTKEWNTPFMIIIEEGRLMVIWEKKRANIRKGLNMHVKDLDECSDEMF